MFVSIGGRFVANLEALNMVETVGNVTKHRRAPVVIRDENGYSVKWVPAISGESFGHAYQENLVRAAEVLYDSPPVCKWCKVGEFYKHMDKDHVDGRISEVWKKREKVRKDKKKVSEYKKEFEAAVIKSCLVEDIGGFLHAEDPPVRRTSLFQVGYIVPTVETINAAVTETQFHARHAPSETMKGEETEAPAERAAQMIYYVELSSAVYGLLFNINLGSVGYTSMTGVEKVLDDEEIEKRKKVALLALKMTLYDFGGKRTRFLPVAEITDMVASVSDLPFTVSSPVYPEYDVKTMERKKSVIGLYNELGLNKSISIIGYNAKADEEASTPEELIKKVMEKVCTS